MLGDRVELSANQSLDKSPTVSDDDDDDESDEKTK